MGAQDSALRRPAKAADGFSSQTLHATDLGTGQPLFLTAGHHVAEARVQARSPHNPRQGEPGAAQREADACRVAAQHLHAVGWPVVTIDTRTQSAVEVAETIAKRVWWRSTAEATP